VTQFELHWVSLAIVNTASTSGISWTGAAQVTCAKGQDHLVYRIKAVEYASPSARANTVVPGQMQTPTVEVRCFGFLKQLKSRLDLGFSAAR
jgi:NAD(P)-dependent dehydrogenase (short-subunit alcohol dehydrogenase family)